MPSLSDGYFIGSKLKSAPLGTSFSSVIATEKLEVAPFDTASALSARTVMNVTLLQETVLLLENLRSFMSAN